jgi:hypothetical protein
MTVNDLPEPTLGDLKISIGFIELLRETLQHDQTGLPEELLHQLYNPFMQAFTLDDPNLLV